MILVVCEGERNTSAEEKKKDTLDIIRRAKEQRGTKELIIKALQLFLHQGKFISTDHDEWRGVGGSLC